MRSLLPGEVGIKRSRLEELTAKERSHDAYLRGMQVLAANEPSSVAAEQRSARRHGPRLYCGIPIKRSTTSRRRSWMRMRTQKRPQLTPNRSSV